MALKCASPGRAKTLARPAWQAARSLTLGLMMSKSAGLAQGNDSAPNIAGRFTWDRISRPTGTFDGKSRKVSCGCRVRQKVLSRVKRPN